MKKNLIANYLGAGIIATSQIVAIPFYVRFLDTAGWGLVSIVLSWTAALLVLEGGVTLSVSRHLALMGAIPTEPRTYFRTTERRYLAAALACIAGAAGLEAWNDRGSAVLPAAGPAWLSLAPLILVLTAAQITGASYRGALVGLGAQVRLNTLTATFGLSKHLASVFAAWMTHSVPFVILCMTALTLTEAYARRVMAYRVLDRLAEQPPLQAAALEPEPGFRSPVALMLASVIGAFAAQVDRLYLSSQAPAADFGTYAIAATLSLATLQLIYPISQALMPRLAEFSGRTASGFLRRVKLIVFLGGVAGLLLFLEFGGAILHWWLADTTIAGLVFPLLMMHLVGTGFNALCVPNHIRLLAQNRDRTILLVNSASLLVQLLSLYFLFHWLGLVAGSIAWTLANATLFLGYWIAQRND